MTMLADPPVTFESSKQEVGPPPQRFQLGYQPALDGLRGLAAAAVVTIHASDRLLPGGYIGVDMFFVLSGFLITSLLIDEQRRNGRLALGRFYLRRALRLTPALAVVLVAVTMWDIAASRTGRWHPYEGLSLLDAAWHSLLRSAAAALYVSDAVLAFGLDDLPMLTHTWSLSVEEHFYLLWPPLVAVLLRHKTYQTGLVVCLTLAAVVAIGRGVAFFAFDVGWERLYYGFGARADALLLGCALAFAAAAGLHLRIPRAVVPWVTWAAVSVLLLALVIPSGWYKPFMHKGPTIAVVLAAAVIVVRVSLIPWAPLVAWLSNAHLVAFGKLSYGLYLWHWPIFNVFGFVAPGLSPLVAVAVSIVVAKASYALIERPVLAFSRARFSV